MRGFRHSEADSPLNLALNSRGADWTARGRSTTREDVATGLADLRHSREEEPDD